MFKINEDGTTIEITRGDEMQLNLSIDDYTFRIGDHIEFRVYELNGFKNNPLIDVSVDIEEEAKEVLIYVSPEETKIGDFIEKPVKYQYEIELNNKQTILGYDEDGVKIFKLFPEGKEITDDIRNEE